jgi:hypothetical protein
MAEDFAALVGEMALAAWSDVAAGRAAGYKGGLQAWNDFTVDYANLIARYDPSDIVPALGISQFLACWSDDVPAFTDTLGRLPKEMESYVKQVPSNQIASQFVRLQNGGNPEADPRTPAARRSFLAAMIIQPGFAPFYGKSIGWVGKLRGAGYEAAIDSIALDLPKDTVREALPELHEQAGELKREKDPEGAIVEYRKALESCPPGDEWKNSRGVMKWKMADVMLAQGQKDKAKETFLTIVPDEIADWLKDRYTTLANKLDVKKEK